MTPFRLAVALCALLLAGCKNTDIPEEIASIFVEASPSSGGSMRQDVRLPVSQITITVMTRALVLAEDILNTDAITSGEARTLFGVPDVERRDGAGQAASDHDDVEGARRERHARHRPFDSGRAPCAVRSRRSARRRRPLTSLICPRWRWPVLIRRYGICAAKRPGFHYGEWPEEHRGACRYIQQKAAGCI